MRRGSNCKGKKKMIALSREACFLLLSNYAEHLTIPQPLTGTALPDPLPAQHPLLPCPDLQSFSCPGKPLNYWKN